MNAKDFCQNDRFKRQCLSGGATSCFAVVRWLLPTQIGEKLLNRVAAQVQTALQAEAKI